MKFFSVKKAGSSAAEKALAAARAVLDKTKADLGAAQVENRRALDDRRAALITGADPATIAAADERAAQSTAKIAGLEDVVGVLETEIGELEQKFAAERAAEEREAQAQKLEAQLAQLQASMRELKK